MKLVFVSIFVFGKDLLSGKQIETHFGAQGFLFNRTI